MKKLKLFCAAAAAFVLTGCCHIDYQGDETQAPLDSGTQVELYFAPEQLPEGCEVQTLGTATAEAGSSWTAAQIEEKLRDFARSKGANALLIHTVDKIPSGKARKDQVKNQTSRQWNVDDTSNNSLDYLLTDMMNYSLVGDGQVDVNRVRVKADLISIQQK